MIRLVIVTLISLVFSFGAISKSLQASRLLNHFSSVHQEHVHSKGHPHSHHDSEDSKKTGEKPGHSHTFEISLLSLSISVTSSQNVSVPTPEINIHQAIICHRDGLNIRHFSSSPFRPPIV